MSAGQTTRTIEEIRRDATKYYNEWGGGRLKGTIDEIEDLMNAMVNTGKWKEYDHHKASSIEHKIREERDKVVQHLQAHRKGAESPVKAMHLEFPSGTSEHDMKEWCLYAKRAAYMVDRFYSHAMRKNPHPKHFDGWSQARYNEDPRVERSKKEQEWLQIEDRLYRIEKRKRRRAQAKVKRAAEGKEHRKPRAHRKAKRDLATPSDPGHQVPAHNPRGSEKAIPAFPERRVSKAAIVPYQRGAARPAQPRVSARLPAFPAFPAYRK